MKKYDHKKIEKKWQKTWESRKFFQAKDFGKKKKFYALVEFPYPSGDGLHVGHVRSYAALDVIARYKRMNGYEVLYPIGWDAFGLPAENFAIKNKIHPRKAVDKNVGNFRKQMKSLGLSFDWSREIDTTDPKYYKWTQWIFLKLYNAGLAYRDEVAINWCPSCKTGLANEEVIDGKHERCGTEVTKKLLKQWLIRITKYADRLLSDLEKVDYPERVKVQQKNWIGRSEGAKIKFSLKFIPGQKDSKHMVEVFTTRPDTVFGATFMVVSPELAQSWLAVGWQAKEEVRKYIESALAKTEIARQDEKREKTGVDTGIKAVNPLTQEEIPVWVADYVLGSYGTGAIMAVPAHDERDFEFAKKFKLPVKKVIIPPDVATGDDLPPPASAVGHLKVDLESDCWVGEGKLVNSGKFSGLDSERAREEITKELTAKNSGEKSIGYKLRDWVFSRQHYWGEPIPIIYCNECGEVPVPEKDLPVTLPKVKNYEPTDTGESPLAAIKKFVETKCPNCKGKARRETDTMPNWAGSNWYFLRYLDPKNNKVFADRKKIDHWMPVDLYNGGMEHTTLHLLYSRFIYKFLYDQGLVAGMEPYARRTSHGIILAEDGRKMSKSFGNVVNPDDLVNEYGADALRMYEMFIAPFDQMVPWSTRGVVGVQRFIVRTYKFFTDFEKNIKQSTDSAEEQKIIHRLIRKITQDLEDMKFNTSVSSFMESVNTFEEFGSVSKVTAEKFLILLSPFAPHLTEELWAQMGHKKSIQFETWPKWDEKYISDDILKIVVQVNGRVRDKIDVPANLEKNEIENLALSSAKVEVFMKDKTIVKTIYIRGRLVNFVVK
ncbi:MAG: leucine--tRNA ligase [Candidatus Doudnabacteria bacterium RIFCSPHIGHO2_01_FULL_43_23]|uniref:Leucine--tRNA ligase n=1 Tax=Candidatus Doudnabacteria bacterium RIFCSPHIGHO2_01_FULL_43_23 TaxID=1817822 RepID=A0A1F5NTG5_9BACT|nr:MAG: leucine--tRNA ligase [Candidatus Doudnabacteria bacterium RIFCSPHIGHO2_01_FULL_43_23]